MAAGAGGFGGAHRRQMSWEELQRKKEELAALQASGCWVGGWVSKRYCRYCLLAGLSSACSNVCSEGAAAIGQLVQQAARCLPLASRFLPCWRRR